MDSVVEITSPHKVRYFYFGFGDDSDSSLLTKLRQKIAPLRFNLAAQAIIQETGITKDSRVLEIGCGVGLLGQVIKEKLGITTNYYGIDLNHDPALLLSKKKGLAPIRADASKLPFADETFDSIISTDVFEHIPDAACLVKEVKRVLKPGGKAFIVISDPSEGRFQITTDHIDRTGKGSDVQFWTNLFQQEGFSILPRSEKYRHRDWRRVFNLPLLRRVKGKPVLSCAFDLVSRPGVFILSKN